MITMSNFFKKLFVLLALGALSPHGVICKPSLPSLNRLIVGLHKEILSWEGKPN